MNKKVQAWRTNLAEDISKGKATILQTDHSHPSSDNVNPFDMSSLSLISYKLPHFLPHKVS
jgi:hypothetical protein